MISEKTRECRYLVLDLTRKGSRGHFVQASIDILNALYENGEKVTFVAEYADEVAKRLISNKIVLHQELINELNLKDCLEKNLFKIERTHILIMWSGDLLNFDFTSLETIMKQGNADLSIITNASKILRGWPNSGDELFFINKLSEMQFVKDIWIWDPAAKNQGISPKIRWLPEYHASFVGERTNKHSRIVVGFYGSLSIDRGLGDLLLIAALNPELSFRIKGYGNPNFFSWRPLNYRSKYRDPFQFIFSLMIAFILLILTRLKNVQITKTYFETDEMLVEDMRTCSVSFYSADRHPYSSGINLLALAAAVPVIWLKGNSAANDNLYAKFPPGIFERKYLLSRRRFRKKLSQVLNSEIVHLSDWEILKYALKDSHLE
jgi:hypothetical protein